VRFPRAQLFLGICRTDCWALRTCFAARELLAAAVDANSATRARASTTTAMCRLRGKALSAPNLSDRAGQRKLRERLLLTKLRKPQASWESR
jgi:hypothetical protein